LFYGLGSDGTVGANKNSIKIIGEDTDNFAQGYFVYDSKKSGSVTVSHLRFGPDAIRSTYLIDQANFIACHQWEFLQKFDILKDAKDGSTFLLNSPFDDPQETWMRLPQSMQQRILDKGLKVYAINAYKVARSAGMGNRINTVMQVCFFALAGVMPKEEAIEAIKKAIRKTYGKKGEEVVAMNIKAVDSTLDNLYEVPIGTPSTDDSTHTWVPDNAPPFVRDVLGKMMARQGDALPVSALPADGTYPNGTTKYEKRNVCQEVPVWDPDVCVQCGKCVMVCPHAVIRSKVYDEPASARCARQLQEHQCPRQSLERPQVHHSGGGGRLHRLRPLCGCVPRQEQGGTRQESHQHGRATAHSRARTGELGLLPEVAQPRPQQAGFAQDLPPADAGTPVRVLWSLCRLRRNPLHQTGHPVVWGQNVNRQRHRLFLHLWRQPAHHPLHP
jgi:Pyruvate/2-oxoacid:ferredoxin oxidoreductase gamma subunit/ferredoxin